MTIHSIVIQKLLSTNAHLGRRVAAHHFKVYICGSRNGIAILDSDKTLICLRNACHFIGSPIRQKGRSFFVNTNSLFDEIIEQMATRIGCINDSQWRIGGFLTNCSSPKKIHSRNKKINFGSNQQPDCVVIIDADRKSSVILEADRLQIPIASLVDSNIPLGSYKRITYPIPANDPIQFVYLFRNSITKTVLLERGRIVAMKETAGEETTHRPELLQALLGGLTNKRKMELVRHPGRKPHFLATNPCRCRPPFIRGFRSTTPMTINELREKRANEHQSSYQHMNILRPLSPHLPIYKPQLTSTFPIFHRMKRKCIPFLFLAILVLFFYLVCMKIGLLNLFWGILKKGVCLLGVCALQVFLKKRGAPGPVSIGIPSFLRAIIDCTEGAPLLGQMMLPGGTDPGASSSAAIEGVAPVPAAADRAPIMEGVAPVPAAAALDLELRLGLPPIREGVAPGPDLADRVVGGDSVYAIQRRLLEREGPNPPLHTYDITRYDAIDRFLMKEKILRRMQALDPEGPWLERGARALDNPRTATGEETVARLHEIFDQLQEGRESEAFKRLKNREYRR